MDEMQYISMCHNILLGMFLWLLDQYKKEAFFISTSFLLIDFHW